MSLPFDFDVNVHIPDETHANNNTVLIALETYRLRTVKYRFRVGSTLWSAFNVVRVANGSPLEINTSQSFLARVGLVQNDPDVSFTFMDANPDWNAETPITHLDGNLPRDYSLGLIFYGNLYGLRDLDITFGLTRISL